MSTSMKLSMGQTELMQSIKDSEKGFIRLSERMCQDANINLDDLVERGLINAEINPGFRELTLTLDGQETLRALTNTQPELAVIEDAPTAETVAQDDEILEWRLIRAWSLTTPAPVGKNGLWMLGLAAKYEQKLIDHLSASDLSVALEDPRRPVTDPRDARIAELEQQVKALQAQIAKLKRRADLDDGYIDFLEAK